MAVKTVLCLWVALSFASSLGLEGAKDKKNEDAEEFPLYHFKDRQGSLFRRNGYEDTSNFPLRHFKDRQGLLFKRNGYEYMEDFPLHHFMDRQPLLLKRGHPFTIHMPPTNQNSNEMEDIGNVASQDENDGAFHYEYLRPIFITKKYMKYDNIDDDFLRYFRNRLWRV